MNVAVQSLEVVRPFHGARPPSVVIQKENPAHRLMIYMAAAGRPPSEIAVQTDYSEGQVRNLLNQEWAKQEIARLMHEVHSQNIMPYLKATAVDAALALNELVNDKEVPAATRLKAAETVLDRVYGKATQTVMHGAVPVTEAREKIKDLRKKLGLPEVGGN